MCLTYQLFNSGLGVILVNTELKISSKTNIFQTKFYVSGVHQADFGVRNHLATALFVVHMKCSNKEVLRL